MFQALEKGKAHGVIMHKIDRGARNLKDWADLGKLIDSGIEVHFANENLDLQSRGGRLSADIQAVVAADYIRNLREEVRKGMYGRLKQGFYPLRAPIGYLDNGSAKAKTICPKLGPLVQEAFERYATGSYTLFSLLTELSKRGLVNRQNKPLSLNGISCLLQNPFYYGLMRIRRTNQVFQGNHEPLITKALFDRVQEVMRRPLNSKRPVKRIYALQRLIRCKNCSYGLYAETQRGIAYYRCHTKACAGTCIREDVVLRIIAMTLRARGIFRKGVLKAFAEEFTFVINELNRDVESQRGYLKLRLATLKEQEVRLTDAYLDRVIDEVMLQDRRKAIIDERLDIDRRLHELQQKTVFEDRERIFLEQVNSLKNIDKLKPSDEIRVILKSAISNIEIQRKNVEITWDFPMSAVFNDRKFYYGEQRPICYRRFTWTKERVQVAARSILLGRDVWKEDGGA
ncbi:Site-specific recombinase [Hahella chejuensis KCTC 2396]|uniref:Site-specific recombinase n=2 Tax=Hahella chejuensis TaxID=158327 RepID=Q2S8J0_HAHCH|nr:Site-specific recombinase [Hahella chejuensis KCTC 2396]